jgi:hypothetical protein
VDLSVLLDPGEDLAYVPPRSPSPRLAPSWPLLLLALQVLFLLFAEEFVVELLETAIFSIRFKAAFA